MRFFLCIAASVVLLSPGAQAQIAPCGSAVCVGSNPQDVNLGGTVLETRGPWPDGGNAILQPVVQGASLVLQSTQSTGTSIRPDVIIRSANVHDGGSILSVRSGTVEVFSVGPGGVTGITGVLDGGPITATNVTGTVANFTTSANTPFATVGLGLDAGSVRIANTYAPIAASQDGGTAAMTRIQFGMAILSSNSVAITFQNAFSTIPQCVCSSVNSTAAACGVNATASASAVTFKGANASDQIQWICIGDK